MKKDDSTRLAFWGWTVLFVFILLFVHKIVLFLLLLLQMNVKHSHVKPKFDLSTAASKTDFDELPAGEPKWKEVYNLWTEGALMHRLRIMHALKSDTNKTYSLGYWFLAFVGHVFLIYIELATGSYYIFATVQVGVFMWSMMGKMNTGCFGVTHASSRISRSWIMRHKKNFKPNDEKEANSLVLWCWMFMLLLGTASVLVNFLMWLNILVCLIYYFLVGIMWHQMETTDTDQISSATEDKSLMEPKEPPQGKFYIP